MLKSYINPIALIRLWALFSRFIIIGLAAIELPSGDFGRWSLVVASIALMSYMIGLDLYAPAIRFVFSSKNKFEVYEIYLTLLFIYSFNFFLLCGLLCFFDELRVYSIGQVALPLVAMLLFFEHLSAEANRQLNLLGELRQANIVLLVRSSLPILIFYFLCLNDGGTLKALLFSQVVGTGAALLPAWIYFSGYIERRFQCCDPEEKYPGKYSGKAKLLLKGCGLVFLATCFLKAGQVIDRQFLSNLTDLTRVGGYALIMAATSAVASVVDAVLISTSMSELLNSTALGGVKSKVDLYHQLRKRIFYLSGALNLLALIGFFVIDEVFVQEKYDIDNVDLMLLMTASFVSNLSLADAALMFVMGMDLRAMWAALIGFVMLCLTVLLLQNSIGANAVACGVLVAAIATWFVRRFSIWMAISEERRGDGNS